MGKQGTVEFNNPYNDSNGVPYPPNGKIKLTISCENLPEGSNPKVFVFFEKKIYPFGDAPESRWQQIGSTETLTNTKRPKFSTSFIFEYYFQFIQNLRFLVYNMTTKSESLVTNDFIGYTEKSISELLVASRKNTAIFEINPAVPSGMKIKDRKHNLKNSRIMISITEEKNPSTQVVMDISCKNLDKMDVIGKSDPYFVLSRKTEQEKWKTVYVSDVRKVTLNPEWKRIVVNSYRLNLGDDDKLLKFEVFDWDRGSDPDIIGEFESSFENIKSQKTFDIVNDEKKKEDKAYVNSGTMTFDSIFIGESSSFSSFLLHGIEIDIAFAIDFTSSNGNPHEDTSLHRLISKNKVDFREFNEYHKAISAVGNVIDTYNSNKKYAVYGFGGNFKKDDNPCFALNENEKNPYVDGIKGVLNVYYKTLENVEFGSQTKFSPIIHKITNLTKKDPSSKAKNVINRYTVLAIITNGEANDMKDTIEAIQDASKFPLSIIFIGVGNYNFENMEKLNGHAVQILANSKKIRDTVRFAQLSDFLDTPDDMASEILDEIPNQIFEYIIESEYNPPEMK